MDIKQISDIQSPLSPRHNCRPAVAGPVNLSPLCTGVHYENVHSQKNLKWVTFLNIEEQAPNKTLKILKNFEFFLTGVCLQKKV